MRPGKLPLPCVAAALLLAAGCSVAPPELMAVGARLVVHATGPDGQKDERLSVFASVADRDGVGDIEYLYIVNDTEELCWTLTEETWQRFDEGSSVWLGANDLDAQGYALPRGTYRVILLDRAGERAEGSFSLSAPDTGGYKVPTVVLSGETLTLTSDFPVNTALFLDSGGNVTCTSVIAQGKSELDSLWADGQWRAGSDYIAVYGLDPKAETGFFSWKIRLPD